MLGTPRLFSFCDLKVGYKHCSVITVILQVMTTIADDLASFANSCNGLFSSVTTMNSSSQKTYRESVNSFAFGIKLIHQMHD